MSARRTASPTPVSRPCASSQSSSATSTAALRLANVRTAGTASSSCRSYGVPLPTRCQAMSTHSSATSTPRSARVGCCITHAPRIVSCCASVRPPSNTSARLNRARSDVATSASAPTAQCSMPAPTSSTATTLCTSITRASRRYPGRPFRYPASCRSASRPYSALSTPRITLTASASTSPNTGACAVPRARPTATPTASAISPMCSTTATDQSSAVDAASPRACTASVSRSCSAARSGSTQSRSASAAVSASAPPDPRSP
mmetsp:Transcript_25/g.73  ORF Transcript_25/g.73 Transcript_25/m.73 type:complete len:260 (-) Transcript_25:33-812(-)